MMTSSISGDNSWLYQLLQTNGTGSANQANDAAGANPACSTTQSGQAQGGPFVDAILHALSQIDTGNGANAATTGSPVSSTSSSSTSASGSSQDPSQALASFMQSLMQALHSQIPPSSAQDGTGGDGTAQVAGTGGRHHHYHHGLQTEMQGLLGQLSSADSSASGSSPTSGATASSTTDSALSNLQQSYQNLLGALGNAGNSPTLSNFLQTVASTMADNSSLGSVMSTTA